MLYVCVVTDVSWDTIGQRLQIIKEVWWFTNFTNNRLCSTRISSKEDVERKRSDRVLKKMVQKYKFKERMCSVRPIKWLEE